MKILFLFFISVAAFAQNGTVVLDTIPGAVGPSGSGTLPVVNGYALITPSNIGTNSSGSTVLPVPMRVPVVSGAISVTLDPGDAGTPLGRSYQVNWFAVGVGAIATQVASCTWLVPTSSTPVTVASIQTCPGQPPKIAWPGPVLTMNFTDPMPQVSDAALPILMINSGQAIHLRRVYCAAPGDINSAIALNLDMRTESTITTDSGHHLLGVDLPAVPSGAATTAFSASPCGGTTNCAVPAHHPVVLTLTTLTGVPTALNCSIDYTVGL